MGGKRVANGAAQAAEGGVYKPRSGTRSRLPRRQRGPLRPGLPEEHEYAGVHSAVASGLPPRKGCYLPAGVTLTWAVDRLPRVSVASMRTRLVPDGRRE